MANNINDLNKFNGNKLPLKGVKANKIKDEIKHNENKKNCENKIDSDENVLIERNSPSEILGRTQVKNTKSYKLNNDNFDNDMAFIEKNYKAVSVANRMFDEFMNNGFSYVESSLLSRQFIKEIG